MPDDTNEAEERLKILHEKRRMLLESDIQSAAPARRWRSLFEFS
ncbi:hypothetical protein BURMUCF2_B0644 [Burkholderia multivorans CF2]|nr:hypothetical protein BURMUCF2_B0644 [Burkholderia multivorans CF2]